MDTNTLKLALANQYIAGLKMLRQCIELCPPDLYEEGVHPRTFVRIAYHGAFYTRWYLTLGEDVDVHIAGAHPKLAWLWGKPAKAPTPTQSDLIAYIDKIISEVRPNLEVMDLDASYCGFSWYKSTSKLEHQFVNLRHLEGHVGQLSELLMARGIYIDWIG
ncbi:MAG TPA: hypothetical protein VK171_10815 [Fimbriimonas sp.]|nr:hypothetical protein [Fimbriimonas sp.]